jgi:class 3 adenylate cyclase
MATCLARRSNWRRGFAAMLNQARILVDQVVLDQWQGTELRFSNLGEVTPKGFDHAVRVYDVNWTAA